jgi:hypothetical protein
MEADYSEAKVHPELQRRGEGRKEGRMKNKIVFWRVVMWLWMFNDAEHCTNVLVSYF